MWYRYLMDTTSWNMMSAACPTRQVLDRVADKWTMLVILALEQRGTLRFSQLRREVDGVTQKMLTRVVIPTVPVTVNYTLTELGHRLSTAVAVIREWAYDNIGQIETARTEYETRSAAPVPS